MGVPKERWSNRDLREHFALFNSRYFNNSLPAVRLSFRDISLLGHTIHYRVLGDTKTIKYGIHISNRIRWSKRLWVGTLLHEMVHLKQKCKYGCGPGGHHFNREMKRLARLGAFNGIW